MDKEKLVRLLYDIVNKSPVIILNKASVLFKNTFKSHNLEVINTLDDLFNIRKHVFNDSSIHVFQVKPFLLNTDEFKLFVKNISPLIILTEDYNIEIQKISYFKTIIKFSDISKCNFLGANEAQEEWKVAEDKSNILNFYAKESPELYYYKNKFSINKYIDLFSSE